MTTNDDNPTTTPEVSENGQPQGAAKRAPLKRSRWRRSAPWALAGLVVLGAVAAWSNSLEKPAAASTPPDVPRVDGDAIVFSEAYAKRIRLELATVKKAQLTPVVWVVGTVAFDPQHMAAVGTRLRGLVRKVHKFEGNVVQKGDLLAEVESAELGEAQAAVATLEAELRAAEINAERERQLLEKQLSTAREFELAQAELSKYKALRHAAVQRVSALSGSSDGRGVLGLGRHAIRSPISGDLIARHVSAGQSVAADLVAFQVANLDQLWVELAVFEQNLASVRVGDAVVLTPTASPNERIEGHVAHIGAQIDPDTRSADVRIAIDNKERKLRPGQAVSAEIQATEGAQKPVLLVPSTAITVIDGQPTVFVSDGPTSVRAVDVELGATNGDQQQVVKGLEEGQSVVTRGAFAIKSELFR